MNEIVQLLTNVGVSEGTVKEILQWGGVLMALRLTLLKWIQGWLADKMTAAIQYVRNTPEGDDDALMVRIFSHPAYRLFRAMCDVLLSVKLPSASEFTAQKE